MVGARDTGDTAVDLDDQRLDRHFSGTYGIFSGIPGNTAVLLFSPERARWVAEERWHRDQQARFHADGGYELRIPYDDPRFEHGWRRETRPGWRDPAPGSRCADRRRVRLSGP